MDDTAPGRSDLANGRAIDAAPTGGAACLRTHSLPRFEGRESRSHHRAPMWRLRLLAEAERWRRGLCPARVFAQFIGFPRSGHSLIGAMLDAHPDAMIAHELDAVGLARKGLPGSRMAGLIARNADAFTRAGRWWNGFRYAVEGGAHGARRAPRAIGDKKGDWAARWCAADPEFADGFARALAPMRCKWLLVVRHPMDNVATMSLRVGRRYDRLRIDAASGGDFREALRRAQADGRIAAAADDEMIGDYLALCASIEAVKSRAAPEDWLEVVYEDFVSAPAEGLKALAEFLELDPTPGWIESAANLARPTASRSRDKLAWSESQRATLAKATREWSFLAPYDGDF